MSIRGLEKKKKKSPRINFLTLNAVIDANVKSNLGADFALRTDNINLPADGEEESFFFFISQNEKVQFVFTCTSKATFPAPSLFSITPRNT